MTILLEVEGAPVVEAPGDGDATGDASVPPGIGSELQVTVRSADRSIERAYRLRRWSGRPWSGTRLSCQVSRHGTAVQPYVAWAEPDSDHDPDGMAEYRLQPFMLDRPESPVRGGVFERGFCWSGRVTPGWIRMGAICAEGDAFCFRTYHAGFAELGYAYCDRDSAVGTWNALDEPAEVADALREWRTTGDRAAFDRAAEEIDQRLDGQLCPCGGSFRFLNPLRCPEDGSVYVDMADPRRRTDEYYFIQLHGRPIVDLHIG